MILLAVLKGAFLGGVVYLASENEFYAIAAGFALTLILTEMQDIQSLLRKS